MKINRMLLLLAPLALLRGCTAAPPPLPAPPQSARPLSARPLPVRPITSPAQPASNPGFQPPRPIPSAAPASTALGKPASPGWRDAPQTPGVWTYAAEPGGSAARFGRAGAAPLLVLRCDRTRPALLIQRPGLNSGMASGSVPAAITTSGGARRLSAAPVSGSPAAQNGAILFEMALNTTDPLLDGMAFSRGRFMVELAGAPALVLPAWAEVGRVIEDCR